MSATRKKRGGATIRLGETNSFVHGLIFDVVEEDVSPLEKILKSEEEQTVGDCLRRLGPIPRAIAFKKMAGLANGEIAAELGISPSTVKRKVQEIRKALETHSIGPPDHC